MSVLTVGELLLEADQQVRELTFAVGPFDADALLAGWGGFLAAAADVAANLPTTQPQRDLQGLLTGWRWAPSQPLTPDPRLATAIAALTGVAELTRNRDLAGLPDLAQVAGHLCAIVCVGAHATAASIRGYLKQTQVSARHGRANTRLEATSQVPRFTFTLLVDRVERAEALTLIGLGQAGRYARPETRPAATDQVEQVTERWAQVAARALSADAPSILDLRTIARVNAQLAAHTRHLIRAGLEVEGAVTPAQELELRPALQQAADAWFASGQAWHPAMDAATTTTRDPDLTAAGIDAEQTWKTITIRGTQWATGTQIATQHDLGDLLQITAQHHQRAALMGPDYTAAVARLLTAGAITIPAQLSQQLTGTAALTRRVPLTADHPAAAHLATGQVETAAEAARIALDTTLTNSPAASAARARLPLKMASSDLDAAIRQRLDTLTQQRAHRAEQAKPAKTGRAARGGDDPPPPRPGQTPVGPHQS